MIVFLIKSDVHIFLRSLSKIHPNIEEIFIYYLIFIFKDYLKRYITNIYVIFHTLIYFNVLIKLLLEYIEKHALCTKLFLS